MEIGTFQMVTVCSLLEICLKGVLIGELRCIRHLVLPLSPGCITVLSPTNAVHDEDGGNSTVRESVYVGLYYSGGVCVAI